MKKIAQKFLIFLGNIVFSGGAYAAINDLYPGDYIPAPAGQSAFAVYTYFRESEGVFTRGITSQQKQRENTMAIFLAARYFNLRDTRFALSGSVGYASQSTADAPSASENRVDGVTDPKISLTFWPFSDEQKFRYFAVNFAHIFGIGSYDNLASQNIGQNRDRSSLSLAWVQRVSPTVIFEATGEIARYGTNTNYLADSRSLDQRSTRSLTGFLRHRLNDFVTPYIGYRAIWGGETSVNGIPQGDTARAERAYLGLRLSTDQKNIFHIRAEADTKLVSGYKLTQGLSIRWTTLQ